MTVTHGYAFPGSGFGTNEDAYQVLTPANFRIGGGFKHASPKSYTGQFPEKFILPPGSLVISMTDLSKAGDTLGSPALLPEGRTYLHNQRIGRVSIHRPDLLDIRFVNYFLRSTPYRDHILGTASGSTVRHTSPDRILDFMTELPTLYEQRAIAEVLGALDDKIAANQQSSHLALRLAILSVPTGMPKIRLGAVTAYNRSSINPDGVQEPRVKHYSLPAFDASKVPTTESPLNIKSSKVLLLNPVVLLSKLNPRTPRIWEVPSIDGICLASGEFLALEPIGFSTSALWAVLSQKEVTRALEERVSGTSGSHQRVLPNDVLALEIHDPNEMSDSLRDLIGASTALSHSLSVENTELSRLRDTLLPALMSGKLHVKDAERAVEDVL